MTLPHTCLGTKFISAAKRCLEVNANGSKRDRLALL